ncbi:MAG: anti-sigma regulatory factor, partial [Deltaproteobacteria bacterium]|nr:anti-sigma regulatory factor [Deltaproteobacteria bacterium]
TVIEIGKRGIEIVARDTGPGIEDLDAILAGRFKSKRGMGIGLMGTKKLMDEFSIETGPDKGTEVRVKKFL